jgi:thiol-disulfide isomerase/thioredoxin
MKMTKMFAGSYKAAFAVMLWCCASSIAAQPPTVTSSTTSSSPSLPLDFELPIYQGTGFLKLSTLEPKPTLINFWHHDCPPCRRELPLLVEYAATKTQLRIVAVAAQNESVTAKTFATVPKNMFLLNAPIDSLALLRRFQNKTGGLPHTVVLNSDRSLCLSKTGEVTREWLDQSATMCS